MKQEAIFISGALNASSSKTFLHNCHLMNMFATEIEKIHPYYYNPIADLNVTLTKGCKDEQHYEWLNKDLFWLEKCGALALVPNPNNKNSVGVAGEIEKAKEMKIPILKTFDDVRKWVLL